MTETASKPVTVESALRSIIDASQDRSLTEKRLRTQVWGYAKAAIELLDAQAATTATADASPPVVDDVASVEVPVVAWLLVRFDRKEVRTKLPTDKDGLSEAVALCLEVAGEIIAWRWADGGGYNANYRYSFVDPLEDPEEVEAQGAESVIACEPLYRHPLARGYKL
ncbi:hypothetical protein G6L37_00145 [Agrobacterium rubi]|nr:hypothetical protein [Agrobacterium rubi]NTF23660.1 hypothetical protein [Agrobacterium rubi]